MTICAATKRRKTVVVMNLFKTSPSLPPIKYLNSNNESCKSKSTLNDDDDEEDDVSIEYDPDESIENKENLNTVLINIEK